MVSSYFESSFIFNTFHPLFFSKLTSIIDLPFLRTTSRLYLLIRSCLNYLIPLIMSFKTQCFPVDCVWTFSLYLSKTLSRLLDSFLLSCFDPQIIIQSPFEGDSTILLFSCSFIIHLRRTINNFAAFSVSILNILCFIVWILHSFQNFSIYYYRKSFMKFKRVFSNFFEVL